MKELLENKTHLSLEKAKNLVLIDTCFLIHNAVRSDKLKQMQKVKNIALTSFNIEEALYVERRLKHDEKHSLRKFFKETDFVIVDIPVHPGNKLEEKVFVDSISSEILAKVPDPSDAVLIAAAIKTNSIVLTKDKHHLFTVTLENFLENYNIKVFKDLHSYYLNVRAEPKLD